jgi:hypothetical protein
LLVVPLLAHPIVLVLPAGRCVECVALVQFGALLFWFPAVLNNPLLIAVGAVRHTLTLTAMAGLVSLIVTFVAASYGLRALVLSTFVIIPFHIFVALQLVRLYVPFC